MAVQSSFRTCQPTSPTKRDQLNFYEGHNTLSNFTVLRLMTNGYWHSNLHWIMRWHVLSSPLKFNTLWNALLGHYIPIARRVIVLPCRIAACGFYPNCEVTDCPCMSYIYFVSVKFNENALYAYHWYCCVAHDSACYSGCDKVNLMLKACSRPVDLLYISCNAIS